MSLWACDISGLSAIYDGGSSAGPLDLGTAPPKDFGLQVPETGVIDPVDLGPGDLGVQEVGAEDLGPADSDVPDQGQTPAFDYAPSNFDPNTLTPLLGFSQLSGLCIMDTTDLSVFGPDCPVGWSALPDPEDGVVILPLLDLFIGTQAELRVTGALPIIFAVFADARVEGLINASAAGAVGGPGALSSSCLDGAGADSMISEANPGGGGGGGFGQPGGSSVLITGNSVMGGLTEGNLQIVPLRAGCPGGAVRYMNNQTATGGAGGGALQISTIGTLTISGAVTVSGGGGGGGFSVSGGGGGGSGGSLLLEGDTVELKGAAALTANGGGGGAPGARGNGGVGEDGAHYSAEPASGASNPNGAGGAGGARGVQAEDGGFVTFSSGGGGGGVGRIRINAPRCVIPDGATISPQHTGC